MTADRRIKRLYPALGAKERVILFLEDRKAGRLPDTRLGATTPPEQRPELDRLIKNLGVANLELASLILALSEASKELAWRLRWFELRAVWLDDLAMRDYLALTDVPDVRRARMDALVECIRIYERRWAA